jgi:internalin A
LCKLTSYTKVSDLEPLRALTNLTVFGCRSTQAWDVEPLRALTNLTELDCSYTPVSQLDPLRALTSLTELSCSNLENLRGVPHEVTEGECAAKLIRR